MATWQAVTSRDERFAPGSSIGAPSSEFTQRRSKVFNDDDVADVQNNKEKDKKQTMKKKITRAGHAMGVSVKQ